MDGLTAHSISGGRFLTLIQSPSSSGAGRRTLPLPPRLRRPSPTLAASSDDGSQRAPDLDRWDEMELKFGRLLGEDPKLTLAKIMTRKENPGVSYLEVEESYYGKKKKHQSTGPVEEVPLDWAVKEPNPVPPPRDPPVAGLGAPKRAGRGTASAESELKLSRPSLGRGVRKPAEGEQARTLMVPQAQLGQVEEKGGVEKEGPEVVLRKPPHLPGDDTVLDKPSKVKVMANLSIKPARKGAKSESLSEMALLKKPEVVKVSSDAPVEGRSIASSAVTEEQSHNVDLVSVSPALDKLTETVSEDTSTAVVVEESVSEATPAHATLTSKPQRLDLPSKEEALPFETNISNVNYEFNKHSNAEVLITAEQRAYEENDWRRAEELLQTGERVEVELISCSTRGFVVSFGSLVGFLPYKSLGAKWKFLAFESWLRKKGLDPSLYRQNLSIIGNYPKKDPSVESNEVLKLEKKDADDLDPSTTFEELLAIYDNEKTRFLSSFAGQRIRVVVVKVERKSRRIMFSGRQKENEELVEKKRSLMARLSIGDIVKCCIKKITFFGIFVEIEDVPALIHNSEISWDAAFDPSSLFKIGQIVEAKVYQLDYSLERITLSLKEIMPDPLNEALESVVGERADAGIETVQGDIEWPDVESLIKELERTDGVIDVSKGRFFLSPGLAPTFQVYMSSMYENHYKLLARFENKVQEVIVQASLDKEQMKAAILTCTNRVQQEGTTL